MPLGLAIRAVARRVRRAAPLPPRPRGFDFSSTLTGATLALVTEDC